jgi:predicted membrane channel-forming protein YqfA (hemolysin III family)
MFLAMGMSGVLPMTHAALQFGIPQARRQMGWAWYVGEGIFYVSGAAIYAVSIMCQFFLNPARNEPPDADNYCIGKNPGTVQPGSI